MADNNFGQQNLNQANNMGSVWNGIGSFLGNLWNSGPGIQGFNGTSNVPPQTAPQTGLAQAAVPPAQSTAQPIGVAAGKPTPPPGQSYDASGNLTPNFAPSTALPTGTGSQNIGGGNSLANPSNPGNPAYQVSGTANYNNLYPQSYSTQNVPNVDYSDPSSRAGQINALTQSLAAGANGTPEETQLSNEISGQQQGLQDTLSNNILTSGDEGILTGRNAAANAQYQGRINSLTSLLGGLQQQRQLSLQGQTAALGGAENNVPATQVLNPAQTLVSPFGGGQVAGSGNNFTGGQALGQVIAGENQIPLQQAYTAGEGTAQTINSYLQQNPSLNPTQSTLANGLDQWVRSGQLGDPKYQTLANYLTDYATKMAPLLSAGGTVTDAKLALQQSLVNGQANGQSISQVLAQLGSLANSNLQNFASGAQGGGVVAGGANVANAPGGTNQGTVQAGGYTYVQNAQGQWVAQ